MARLYGFDGKVMERFCELNTLNAIKFVNSFAPRDDGQGATEGACPKAMTFMEKEYRCKRSGDKTGNAGALWWKDPACFYDASLFTSSAKRKRPEGMDRTGRPLTDKERLDDFYMQITRLKESFVSTAEEIGEPLLQDFYETAVVLHRQYAKEGKPWDGNGCKDIPPGHVEWDEYLKSGASIRNMLLAALLLVRGARMFMDWVENMGANDRRSVHGSIASELEDLNDIAKKYVMPVGEPERRKKVREAGSHVNFSVCSYYLRHGECKYAACKYLHVEKKEMPASSSGVQK